MTEATAQAVAAEYLIVSSKVLPLTVGMIQGTA